MPKFKVLESSHSERSGKGKSTVYEKGQIVESKRDLVALFGPKNFERVASTTKVSAGHSLDADLAKRNKEQKLPGLEFAEEATSEATSTPPAEETASTEATGPSLGEDITGEFKAAEENALLVFRDEHKKYHIADADNPASALAGPLNSKKAVTEFLESYEA